MDVRKIQLVGNRSYAVSLPKEWVLKNNLKQKDKVYITESSSNKLSIKLDSNQVQDKKQMEINLDNISHIPQFVVFCYVKNIDIVTFYWKKNNVSKVRKIKQVLNYLDGYDIIDESNGKIEIAFLFNDVNITLQKIIRRLMHLLKVMVNSCKEKDYQLVEETENSIDRLYHLSRRILFLCMKNNDARKENGIFHGEDIYFYSEIMKRLEQIGDQLYMLKDQKTSKEELDIVYNYILDIEKMFISKKELVPVKNYYENSKNSKLVNICNRITELSEDIFENLVAIEFDKNYN